MTIAGATPSGPRSSHASAQGEVGRPRPRVLHLINNFEIGGTERQAIELLKDNLRAGDTVLIKGSHGLRMDRITAALELES